MFFFLAALLVASAAGFQGPAQRVRHVSPELNGLFDKLKNPFDSRPGATVGLVQVALNDEKAQTSKFIAETARSLNANSARGLARFVEQICTGLSRRDDDWAYATASAKYFKGSQAEKSDHERYYNRLVNVEASKFEKEYLPSAADLAKAKDERSSGFCVVSLVVALEGDLTTIFDGAASSITNLRVALGDISAAASVDDGYALYNAEVLWTPSSPDETLLRDEMLLDFPELLAL